MSACSCPPLPFSKRAPLGLCHGILRRVLPPPDSVVDKCRSLLQSPPKLMLILGKEDRENSIIQLLNHTTGTEFKVVLSVPNSLLNYLAHNAQEWVNNYVTRYEDIVTHVCVGDLSTLLPEDFGPFTTAITEVNNLLQPRNIKVSTMVDVSMLANYSAMTPPSGCNFVENYKDLMKNKVIPLLIKSSSPIFAKIFPYFQINHEFDDRIKPSNYLINDEAGIYMDDEKYHYKYVYDAMLDSIYCAMDNLWKSPCNVPVIVVTGWPAEGPKLEATTDYQMTYLGNLCTHVTTGTPRKDREFIPNYVYCLVNQDRDPRLEEEWREFGILPYHRSDPGWN